MSLYGDSAMRYSSRDIGNLAPYRDIPLRETAKLELARRGLVTFSDLQPDIWYRWFYGTAPMPALRTLPLP